MNARISFSFLRKAGRLLLAATLLPCLAVARAGEADWSSAGPGMLGSTSAGQPQAVTPSPTNAPGTPYSFTNPRTSTIIVTYGAKLSQTVPVNHDHILFDISTVVAGDIVMLRDPAGSNDPSNWVAVFRFLSLADPTGAQGSPADKVQGFDASNTGPGGFTGFQLFPNTVYLADTEGFETHSAVLAQLGPSQGILPGQTAILHYVVEVPEPATWLELLAGAGIIAGVLRRRVRL